jgi:transcriptional regulator with XRE-family HTH domain
VIDGGRLEERMKARGLTQAALADRVGLTQQAVGKLVRGASRRSPNLHLIARELGTTPAYLTRETDDPDQGAPTPPELAPDELELLTNFRQLPKEDREALRRFAERMVGPKTVHAPSKSYRVEQD